jgi:Tol biopolymer transport system component
VYVVRADGTDGRILGGDGRVVSAAWSPDGGRIAFVTADGSRHQLWSMDADGEVHRLADAPTCGDAGSPVWSPDGRWLLYHVGEQDDAGHCAAVVNHVFVVPADGSAAGRPLIAAGTDRYTLAPAWGPSGIAMQGNDGRTSELLVADVPDPDRPWDLAARRIDDQPAGAEAFTRPAWSPDGRSIATTHVDTNTRLSFGSARVYPIDGRPPTELGSADRRLLLPAWSPDGTWLAALTPGEDGYQVAIVDTEGRILRTLPTTGVDIGQGPPVISPDGRWIAVRASGYQESGDVLIVDVAGDAEPVRVPAFAGGGLSWQPIPNPDNPAANAPDGQPHP